MTASDGDAQMSGYLHRSRLNSTSSPGVITTSGGGTKFKKMWFVLKDHVLYSYRAPEDTAAVDTCPILGFDFEVDNDVSR